MASVVVVAVVVVVVIASDKAPVAAIFHDRRVIRDRLMGADKQTISRVNKHVMIRQTNRGKQRETDDPLKETARPTNTEKNSKTSRHSQRDEQTMIKM